MRTHGWYSAYELRHDIARLHRIVDGSTPAAARLEPVHSQRPDATLDVIFERDGAFATIALAVVDGVMLLEREADPIRWPRWAKDVFGDAFMRDMNEFLEPWLRSRVLARCENDETLRIFRDDPDVRIAIERARREHFLGAAPLVETMRSLAPATYALRFLNGRTVAVSDPQGANMAALAYGRASRVDLDLGDAERLAFARAWFGTLSFGDVDAGPYDVAIGLRENATPATVRVLRGLAQRDDERAVTVARSLPGATMVSFDDEDSIPDAALAVASSSQRPPRESSVNAPLPVGGSSGRVTLLCRSDWERIPDSDTDAVRALCGYLEREGFTVSVRSDAAQVKPQDADVFHIIGHRHAAEVLPIAEAAARLGVPVVVMPCLDDASGIGEWATPTSLALLRESSDDTKLAVYLDAFARHRLVYEVPVPEHPKLNKDLQALFRVTGCVIACSSAEEQLLRNRFEYRGPTTNVPAIFETGVPANVDVVSGAGDFILLHAPIGPRSNVIWAMMAAQKEHLPLFITGPIENLEYYQYLTRAQNDLTLIVPERLLSVSELEGLYARARVFADVSWGGSGLSRIARAAAYGASICLAKEHAGETLLEGLVEVVEPADVGAIAGGLRRAWDLAPLRSSMTAGRAAERCSQPVALSGVVSAYHQALQRAAATAAAP